MYAVRDGREIFDPRKKLQEKNSEIYLRLHKCREVRGNKDEKNQPMVLHFSVNFFSPTPVPPPHVLVDFVVLPPGHGSSVTDC